MKTLAFIILGIGLGLGVAFLLFRFEHSALEEAFPHQGWPSTGKTLDPIGDLSVTGPKDFTFSAMYSGKTSETEFVLENLGTGVGQVWIDDQPPPDIDINLVPGEKVSVSPGDSFKLTVKATPRFGETLFRRALILQSDTPQADLTFRLSGESLPGLAIQPDRLTLTPAQQRGEEVFEVHVLSWMEKPVDFEAYRSEPNEVPLQCETLALATSIRDANPTSQSGFTLRIRPQEGTTLPSEPWKLRIQTNLDGFADLEIPVIPALSVGEGG